MGNTTNLILPYPELTDAANVPIDMKELAQAVEATQYLAAAPLSTALITAYPAGLSAMYVGGTDGVNWPSGGSGLAWTGRTVNNVGSQWFTGTSSTRTAVWTRTGGASGWGPWVKVADDRQAATVLRGRVTFTVTAANNGSAAVTFPAGVFTPGVTPRVTGICVGSSVWVVSTAANPGPSGNTFVVRHVDGTAVTATVNVDWTAVEGEG